MPKVEKNMFLFCRGWGGALGLDVKDFSRKVNESYQILITMNFD